jgi:hypothetical protein
LENLKTSIIEMGFMEDNVRDTMIVDDRIKLEIAIEIFNNMNYVGVDFEGGLSHGNIWLA